MPTEDDQQFRHAFAHTLPNAPCKDWEPLETHLAEVGSRAAQFADAFGAREWGEILGRCHDLGKYSLEFQRYLLRTSDPDAGAQEGSGRRVDHSTYGARHVRDVIGKHRGQMLAYCIAGHHAGLADYSSDNEVAQGGTLRTRLDRTRYSIPDVTCPAPQLEAPTLKLAVGANGLSGFQVSFFVRMIFSCLIDADRLATERFCDSARGDDRDRRRPSILQLKVSLDGFLEQKQATSAATAVNRVRASVLKDCRRSAELSPGFFSLNVPTGGGKTYSSLSFALHHALRYDLRRVVVAIPFTSIIEQTADAYRVALGSLAERGIIEHHTNIQPAHDTRSNQFGAENWDAPLVVTTNVQFFESLFASATSPCRKLHRLAHSVIVLDEAQTIPVDLLKPALEALKELVLNYGCSIVLCTATQPALERRPDFELGIENVRHIIASPEPLFSALKRTEVHYEGTLSDQELSSRLAGGSAALCIVNTRAQAAHVFDLLRAQADPKTCFHLSTWMCGTHRRRVLTAIRQRLQCGLPCRVVSTQLVEAGVDLDFPTVYRAAAGFDSIAQAAGRCNREGRLDLGHTYVFDGEAMPPPGTLRDAAQTGKELVGKYPNPIAPEAIEAYFRLFYWSQKHRWDNHQVMPPLAADLRSPSLAIQFREASARFKMIRDAQSPILVPYDSAAEGMWNALNRGNADYVSQRTLQPYLVSVHQQFLLKLQEKGLVMEHESGVWLLLNKTAYSDEKGLSPEACGIDPTLLVI